MAETEEEKERKRNADEEREKKSKKDVEMDEGELSSDAEGEKKSEEAVEKEKEEDDKNNGEDDATTKVLIIKSKSEYLNGSLSKKDRELLQTRIMKYRKFSKDTSDHCVIGALSFCQVREKFLDEVTGAQGVPIVTRMASEIGLLVEIQDPKYFEVKLMLEKKNRIGGWKGSEIVFDLQEGTLIKSDCRFIGEIKEEETIFFETDIQGIKELDDNNLVMKSFSNNDTKVNVTLSSKATEALAKLRVQEKEAESQTTSGGRTTSATFGWIKPANSLPSGDRKSGEIKNMSDFVEETSNKSDLNGIVRFYIQKIEANFH